MDRTPPKREPSTDELLRSRDWRIHSRPKAGAILWKRRNVVLTQEQALAVSRREREREERDGTQSSDNAKEG